MEAQALGARNAAGTPAAAADPGVTGRGGGRGDCQAATALCPRPSHQDTAMQQVTIVTTPHSSTHELALTYPSRHTVTS